MFCYAVLRACVSAWIDGCVVLMDVLENEGVMRGLG